MKRGSLFLLIFSFFGGALYGTPKESLALQELKLIYKEFSYQLNSYKTEIDLLHERVSALESAGDLGIAKNLASEESGKTSHIEKTQTALLSDVKSLKVHLEETSSSLAKFEKRLSRIDSQISSDIETLKKSMKQMLALLKLEEASGGYIVKSGDSLGKIALEQKTDIKTLKSLNNLSSDTIIVGQRLQLP